MKMNILVDFQIDISVPLSFNETTNLAHYPSDEGFFEETVRH